MFINRDWNRTEADDYRLNVEPKLADATWATPQYVDGILVGWKLNHAYA